MSISAALVRQTWLWKVLIRAIALLVLLICAWRAISRPWDGDFKLHWESGRRFVAGEFLYSGGHNIPYPPFWAMAHTPASLLPMPIAKALLFPLGIGALVLLLWILKRLAASTLLLQPERAFWVTTLALFLTGRYVIRDMAELGVNTMLVALSWLGIYLWTQRRELLAGLTLGLGIALKCTPVIFVGYFVWKRQWRLAAVSLTAAMLFTLAAIIWQGPTSYWAHIKTWSGNVWKGAATGDPSVGVLGPEPLQNMALRPSLARYLMELPPTHPGRASHSLYFDFVRLSPSVADWIIDGVLVVILGTVMWRARRPPLDRFAREVRWELAAVSILMLLFSPITWGQHCVALIPACYFISACLISGARFSRWMIGFLGFYVLFVPLLSRDLVGRNLSMLLGSYHVETLSILALLAIVLGSLRLPPSCTEQAESA